MYSSSSSWINGSNLRSSRSSASFKDLNFCGSCASSSWAVSLTYLHQSQHSCLASLTFCIYIIKIRGHMQHFSSTRSKKSCKYVAANFIRGAINKNCCRNLTTSKNKMTLTRAQTIACISVFLDEDDWKDFRPSEKSVWVKKGPKKQGRARCVS